jgi:hypothetical protein
MDCVAKGCFPLGVNGGRDALKNNNATYIPIALNVYFRYDSVDIPPRETRFAPHVRQNRTRASLFPAERELGAGTERYS